LKHFYVRTFSIQQNWCLQIGITKDVIFFKFSKFNFLLQSSCTKKFIYEIIILIFLKLRFQSIEREKMLNKRFSYCFFNRINMNIIIIVIGLNSHVFVFLTCSIPSNIKDRVIRYQISYSVCLQMLSNSNMAISFIHSFRKKS